MRDRERLVFVRLCTLTMSIASCGLPETRNWPFAEVGPEVRKAVSQGDASAVIAVWRKRSEGIESLYAELKMASEGGERGGVFETVVYYQAPDHLRIAAFRDLVVSTRSVFDLALSGDDYVLRLDGEAGERVYRGAASDLGAAHAEFEVFQSLRERLFLPGLVFPGESASLDVRDGTLELTAQTSFGVIEWLADVRTLAIREARVRGPDNDERAEIHYLSYRRAGDTVLPERFRIDGASGRIVLSGWLRHVEVNPELDAAILTEPFLE